MSEMPTDFNLVTDIQFKGISWGYLMDDTHGLDALEKEFGDCSLSGIADYDDDSIESILTIGFFDEKDADLLCLRLTEIFGSSIEIISVRQYFSNGDKDIPYQKENNE